MTSNKRTRSISRKINTRAVSRMFWAFFAVDLMVIVLACTLWCVSAEYTRSSDIDKQEAWYFTSVEYLEKEYPEIKRSEAYAEYRNADRLHDSVQIPGTKLEDKLTKVFYVVENKDGSMYFVYCGTFMLMLAAGITVLIIIELLVLLCSVFWGARKIRRDLAPLDELAFKADMLARASSFDQQALDELEEAINRISPSGDGTRLHTSNAELAELEEAINGLLERMRATYRQQARFVSDASHELRTPISVLQGYVNMLDRWGKEDEQVLDESIEAIKSETEHMKKLVEQLLFLARGDSGRTKLTMESFSLNEMMKEVYEESLMIDKNHRYIFRPADEAVMITGDISMLKQTARILIDNAAKYTPEGDEILLRVTGGNCASKSTDAAALPASAGESQTGIPAFVIQDEGIGIGSSDLPHMFERFYRSDPARSKDSGGTGLGLSIAKWIVDRHGGWFDVLSREDIGTRITVYLPQK